MWPEVPAPFYYYEDPCFRERVNQLARALAHATVLIGIVAHTPRGRAAEFRRAGLARGRRVSRYDKVKLVPFGEFVPWPFGVTGQKYFHRGRAIFNRARKWWFRRWARTRSARSSATNRCFRTWCGSSRPAAPSVLFNISNDGWFGKSAAREQHLRIVRMRAAENHRWILRSTNDGITASDRSGRARAQALPIVRAGGGLCTGIQFPGAPDVLHTATAIGSRLLCCRWRAYRRCCDAQPCRITRTSPSLTMYSLPSSRSRPFSRTPG